MRGEGVTVISSAIGVLEFHICERTSWTDQVCAFGKVPAVDLAELYTVNY